jgi:hypothetical protein
MRRGALETSAFGNTEKGFNAEKVDPHDACPEDCNLKTIQCDELWRDHKTGIGHEPILARRLCGMSLSSLG